MQAKWERMSDRLNNQEVGLEAAILERVRNSSLVKWSGADNVTGLKPATDAAGFGSLRRTGSVGEHSAVSEAGR